MNVCTIIAKNYVAYARVLAHSLAETNPGSRLRTLVIDDFGGHIDPEQEPFDVLTPEQVGCEPFIYMALRYSVLELSTAVKPWLLRHLMRETGGPVTYLDPDIRIYGSLDKLDELAAQHGVVLIPHNSRPIPQDGRRPSQVDVMIAGIYNLGYVSLAPRPEVDQLLDWWADRLRRDCRVDPMWGYFVDQRWFDLAPGFLSDLAIVRDPQYNLAYWNLHERRLEVGEAGYTVDGRPLGFFHFSGFDPQDPVVLSRHQDRINVLDQPVLERLLREYAAAVMSEGHRNSRRWRYEFAALGDGTKPDDKLRDLFDTFAAEHDDDVPSPFTLEGVRMFDEWLLEEPAGAPPGINRALARIYEDRADIRGAFPNLVGADLAAFLTWADGPGLAEEPVLARLRGRAGANGSATSPARSMLAAQRGDQGAGTTDAQLRGAPWGVNVIGEFQSETDLGEIARGMVAGLDAAGVRNLPVLSDTAPRGSEEHPYMARPTAEAPFTVNLVCSGPDSLPGLAQSVGREFFSGRFTIGLWFWHGERFPSDWNDRFSLLGEVWVPTAYCAAALAEATIPVHIVPPVVAPTASLSRTRAELSLPERKFVFHSRLDYREGFERQNTAAVIEAFRRAFEPGAGAALLIDCRGRDAHPADHARLVQAAAGHPDIELRDRDAAPGEAPAVLSLCDSYVSLHRAEAFGMPLASAMWLGKPVIATGYSGNLDFMTAENSHLVGHRLVDVNPSDHTPASLRWADPDVEHASALMRRVFDDQDAAINLGRVGAESIREGHSPQVGGEILSQRLETIRVTGRARIGVDPILALPRTLSRLPMRLAAGPVEAAAGPAHAARERLRQAVLRVIRPYTAYQQGINADLVTALAELSRHITQIRDDVAAERGDVLSVSRRERPVAAQTQAGVEEIKRILTLETDRSVYLALSELRGRHAQIAAAPGEASSDVSLTGFELRAFSQNGEDGVLSEILRRVGAPSRYFIEFGVESGREGNCVYLADVAGWRGLFMEAGDEMYRLLARKYSAQDRVHTIQARVTARNVEQLFAQADVPDAPDVVSIDVDGQDYWIWEAIERYRPRVVVIEYNSALDPGHNLVQPDRPNDAWDGTDYQGASLGALRSLAERKDYRLVHTELSAVNAFFVRADLAGQAFPSPDEVAVRGTPNFYQRGVSHPPARPPGRYVELESGKLVSGGREP